MRVKRVLRSAQTLFPWTRSLKFRSKNLIISQFGYFMEPEYRALKKLPNFHCTTAVDIGANWGQSIAALRYSFNPQKIEAFEPNVELFRELAKDSRADLTLHNCGLSHISGTFNLYVPVYRRFVFDGLASLDRAEAANWLNEETLPGFDKRLLEIRKLTVEVRTLDDFHLSPDLIKIDVQGHEESVLRGSMRTLLRCMPILIVEGVSASVANYLHELGYESYWVNHGTIEQGTSKITNSLYVPKLRVEQFNLRSL